MAAEIKIKTIQKVCKDSKNYCKGYYASEYLQLFYDRDTCEVWTTMHSSLGHNSWTVYHNKSIVDCGFITGPVTALEVARIVNKAIEGSEK